MTIATVLATWAVTFMRGKTAELELKAEERFECERAGARIESALYDPANQRITALVVNLGDIDLSDWRLNVYYTPVNVTSYTPDNANQTLSPGTRQAFSVEPITKAPIKILLQSMNCPKIDLYECSYYAGEFRC
jgi:hypothetical protein